MSRRSVRPKQTRREQLKETLAAIPWGSTEIARSSVHDRARATSVDVQPDLFADTVCATCAQPSTVWGVERGEWRVCPTCHQAWLAERKWAKVAPELVAEILAAGVELPACKTCAGPLRVEAGRTPLLFVVEKTGEVASGYCRGCIEQWRSQKTAAALRGEILSRIDRRGRSKGLLSLELVKQGRQIADVRDAFQALLDAGELVQHRGYVRLPSGARRG